MIYDVSRDSLTTEPALPCPARTGPCWPGPPDYGCHSHRDGRGLSQRYCEEEEYLWSGTAAGVVVVVAVHAGTTREGNRPKVETLG